MMDVLVWPICNSMGSFIQSLCYEIEITDTVHLCAVVATAAAAGWVFSYFHLNFCLSKSFNTHANKTARDRQTMHARINWSWFRKLTSIDCKSFLKFVLMFAVKSPSLPFLFHVRYERTVSFSFYSNFEENKIITCESYKVENKSTAT